MLIVTLISGFVSNICKIVKSNIKYKLFFFYFITMLVPIVFFSMLSYKLSSAMLENDYVKYKSRINNQIVKNIDENLKNLSRQSMAIYANLDDTLDVLKYTSSRQDANYIGSYNRTISFFRSILQGNDKLYGITLISPDGQLKLHVDRDLGSLNMNIIKNQYWFDATIKSEGFPILREPHTNDFIYKTSPKVKPVISICRAVVDLEVMKTVGVLVIDQNIDQFSGIFSNVETEQGEIIIVFGKSGDVIYTNHEFNATTYGNIFSKVNASLNTELFKYSLNNETMMVNMKESSEYGWKVVSLIPLSQLREKSGFVRNINIFLLIVLIICTFAISLFVSYLINIPLQRLMSSFKRLQKGDFDIRVQLDGTDELAQIGNTFNNMVGNIKKLIQEKYEIGILRKQAELESLQSQINPHFLFNTLNSIKIVAVNREYSKIPVMVQSLSDIFRYSLNRGRYVVRFSEELAHIRKYLYIQECRFEDKYAIRLDIDSEVLDYDILRLTLQPVVENAIYHGLEPKTGKGELIIAAKAVKDKYYIYISNNGVSIPEHELEQINSLLESGYEIQEAPLKEKVGIYNVNSRIKLHFGNGYGLRIFSSAESTTVKITLPIGMTV